MHIKVGVGRAAAAARMWLPPVGVAEGAAVWVCWAFIRRQRWSAPSYSAASKWTAGVMSLEFLRGHCAKWRVLMCALNGWTMIFKFRIPNQWWSNYSGISFIWIPNIKPCENMPFQGKIIIGDSLFVCNFCAFLGNHHPSLEFDCGKVVLIIRHVCLCAAMHAWAWRIWFDAFSLAVSARRVGGQRRNIAMKPMIRGSLDVTNKLSCHLVRKQKGWRGENDCRSHRGYAASERRFVPAHLSVGSNINTYIPAIHSSPSLPPSSRFPPAKCCQTHICAENEWYPRALWVKDSLVKNAVLLDEQTNVPCNVVALAFYATLKESINLHNSSERVLPL